MHIALLQFSASSRALELIEAKSASCRGTEHGDKMPALSRFPARARSAKVGCGFAPDRALRY